jgi:hypothetical protein
LTAWGAFQPHLRVHRATDRDAGFFCDVEQTPDADALAVFAPGEVRKVGDVAGQGVGKNGGAAGIIGVLGVAYEIPVFEIECDDDRQTLAVGPFERLAFRHRYEVVIHDCPLFVVLPALCRRSAHMKKENRL